MWVESKWWLPQYEPARSAVGGQGQGGAVSSGHGKASPNPLAQKPSQMQGLAWENPPLPLPTLCLSEFILLYFFEIFKTFLRDRA